MCQLKGENAPTPYEETSRLEYPYVIFRYQNLPKGSLKKGRKHVKSGGKSRM